jgi:hypothetical protein
VSPTTPRTPTKLLLLTALCLLTGGSQGTAQPSRAFAHEMYVWQRVWTPEVVAAVRGFGSFSAGWRVLAAQTNGRGDWSVFAPDTATLGATAKTLTAVVRIDGSRDVADADELTERIAHWYRTHNSGWARIEIDYDCPTSRLREYALLLRRLRRALPDDVALSITALPAWIESPDLRGLLAEVDESVLQVHSVLDPKLGLLSAPAATRWFERYSGLTPKPFWVALPNYGSRLSWDGDGRLVAVVSEGEEWANGAEDRELEADPSAVRRVLDSMQAERPRALRGVVWFRMPVRGNRRIWSAAMLEAVINGEPLERKLDWSIERDSAGAFRLVLANSGTEDVSMPRTIRLRHPCRAADGLSGYLIEHDGESVVLQRTTTRMLRSGDSVAVGWMRCEPAAEEIEVEG